MSDRMFVVFVALLITTLIGLFVAWTIQMDRAAQRRCEQVRHGTYTHFAGCTQGPR